MASEGIPTRLFIGQAPITTAAALFTADARTVVKNIHIANVTASTSASLALNVVPKGGTASAANQITGNLPASGQAFAGASVTELITTSGIGGIVLNPGDAIYGLAVTAAADLTIVISGDTYGEA